MKSLFMILALSTTWVADAKESGVKNDSLAVSTSGKAYRSSIMTTYLSLVNFEDEKTNTHHLEFQYRYQVTKKDALGVKFATWKLFAPMGIQLWEPEFLKESEFYNGRLRETGIGVVYQRFLWKGLYASIEILPLVKTYVDANNKKIENGFKLYTTHHIGYHFSLLKKRLFVEPQVHCNYWPIDTKAPEGFAAFDDRWKSYMLFEPNLYIGVAF